MDKIIEFSSAEISLAGNGIALKSTRTDEVYYHTSKRVLDIKLDNNIESINKDSVINFVETWYVKTYH